MNPRLTSDNRKMPRLGIFPNLTYFFLYCYNKNILSLKYMHKIDLKSVVWKEGKYYISRCLEVEVSSFGKTKKEALNNLQKALELYFDDIPLPKKAEIKNPIIASIKLQNA